MKDTAISRRQALRTIGAGLAAGGAITARPDLAPAQTAAPAVRRKVKLSYWNWADNPIHQKISWTRSTCSTSRSSFIDVELDATMAVMEARKKLVVAYAAGAAPDVAGTVQTHVQDYFDNGILQPLDELFNKWDREGRLLSERRRGDALQAGAAGALHAERHPALLPVLPRRLVPGGEARAADTYDEFIDAARKLTKPPERYRLRDAGRRLLRRSR